MVVTQKLKQVEKQQQEHSEQVRALLNECRGGKSENVGLLQEHVRLIEQVPVSQNCAWLFFPFAGRSSDANR